MISGVSAVSFSAPKSQNHKQVKPVAQQRFLGAQQEYSSSAAFTSMGKAQVSMNQGNVSFKGVKAVSVVDKAVQTNEGADGLGTQIADEAVKAKEVLANRLGTKMVDKAVQTREGADGLGTQIADGAAKAKEVLVNRIRNQIANRAPEVGKLAGELEVKVVDSIIEAEKIADDFGDKAQEISDKIVGIGFNFGKGVLDGAGEKIKKLFG